MNRFVFALALAAALAACASTGTNVPPEQLAQILDGKSTKTEIIARLGEPQTTTVDASGLTILTYVYASSGVTPVTLVPYVGLLAGGAKTKSNAITFVFDPAGKLLRHSSSSTNLSVNTGLLNQH